MRALSVLVLVALFTAGCLGGGDGGTGDGGTGDGGNGDGPGGGGSPPLTGTACGAVEPPSADETWKAENPQVRLATTMGDVVLALDLERAPETAGNFLKLVGEGYYDGIAFHRVVKDFVIQGGDPNTKDADPANDGSGGPGYAIDDEFNPTLRHDQAGVVSMATAGPDTGGSQFFITLGATPSLDDRHSVFGRVAEGMDVAAAIGNTPTVDKNGDGRLEEPAEPVVIEDAEVVDPAPYEPEHAVGVHPVVGAKTAEPGRAATFAVILQNEGNVRDAIALSARAPEGWTCQVEEAPVVPAGTGRVVFLALTPPEGASGEQEIALDAKGASGETATAAVTVTLGQLGEQVKQGDQVRANYAGFLPDGRLFDTSMQAVGTDPDMPKFETMGGWQDRGAYQPFEFQVGGNVIQGFTDLALTAKEGETVTMRIPAEKAYAQGNMYQRPLTGRDLVFELEILEIL